jgi:hypothetical protein
MLAAVKRPPLPRWRADWPHAWLAPVLAAACWALALGSSTEAATQRSLVFIGGPLVLLAGLHARLTEYLHGRARERLAPLPIVAGRHFAAAQRVHMRGLGLAIVCGVAGVLLGARAAGGAWVWAALLAGDFVWLGVLALLIEPAIPALAAYAGRRFPNEHPIRQAQAQLGGGWTSPEATVHLYAPALGLGLAALLAMPGQLGLALLAEGQRFAGLHAGLLGVPLVIAGAVRVAAPRVYTLGFFEAVAWLAEATRSLAGPPEPPPRPAWVARVASPATRLLVTQWLRLTAVPLLRLTLLLGWGGYLLLRAAPPSGPTIAIGLGLAALWLAPLQTLARQRRRNAALLAGLPLPAGQRAGGSAGLTLAIAGVPAGLLAGLLGRWLVL